jgi:hypothetical protein
MLLHVTLDTDPKNTETNHWGECVMHKLRSGICIFILMIFACASIKETKKLGLFDETTRAYARAIRWTDFETANAFLKISDSDSKLPDFEKLKQIKVTSYEVKQTILATDKSGAIHIVEIQYFNVRNVTVKTLRDRQFWEYDEKEERWFLISGLPDFE